MHRKLNLRCLPKFLFLDQPHDHIKAVNKQP